MSLIGKDKLIANMHNVLVREPEVLARAMYVEGESIITDAKNECPVRYGVLRASGHVQEPVIGDRIVTVKLGFGGPAAPYAVFVHENLEASHAVGKAKFLEDPMNRHAATMLQRIGEEVSVSLK